jgi:hypothetical protein
VQRTEDGCVGWVLGGQIIVRSGDVVCDLYHAYKDEKHMFLG